MDHYDELEALRKTGNVVGQIETLTPHKIAVVVLIHEFIKVKHSIRDLGIIFPANSRRTFCNLLLKLIQEPDLPYNELHDTLSSGPYHIEKMHMEHFEESMTLFESLGIEYLFDLCDMDAINEKIVLRGGSQVGIVGFFLRRIIVTANRTTFTEMRILYKNICNYYKNGLQKLALAPRRGGLLDNTEDITNSNMDISKASSSDMDFPTPILRVPSKLSRVKETDQKMEFGKWSSRQAYLFVGNQLNLYERNEPKMLPPIQLEKKLNEIIQDRPLMSQAYFLSYLNHLRLRDYFGAVDALHRAFDRNPLVMTASGNGFQFFSLNMAILHSNFGHREEALTSLKECIMLSQECNDKKCLELANSWYCIIQSNRIDPFEKYLPDLGDSNQLQLLSSSIQFIVKIGAQCGYLPLDLFAWLIKSDGVNQLIGFIDYTMDSLALRSAVWSLYGKYETSSVFAQILLGLNKSLKNMNYENSESVCLAFCTLALQLNLHGNFLLAHEVINEAKIRFPRNPFAKNWMICQSQVDIQQCLYKCKWQEALKYCDQLYILDKPNSMLLRAAVYIGRKHFFMARVILKNILDLPDIENLQRVRALILLAYTSLGIDNFSSDVIDIINHAQSLASQFYLEFEQAQIDMLHAHTLMYLNLPKMAVKCCVNSIEHILSNGGIYDKAKANFLFAQCVVAAASSPEEKLRSWNKSLKMVNDSIEWFKKVEAYHKVLDVYVWMAQTSNELKNYTQRNMYSKKFRNYLNEFNVQIEYMSMCF